MHKCRNPKFCPICRRKIRNEVKNIFIKNPDIILTQENIMKIFKVDWWIARNVLYSLRKVGVIEKRYDYNKRMTTAGGVKTAYFLNKDYRPIQVKSRTWRNIF